MLDDTKGGIIVSLFSSLKKLGKNFVGGFSDMTKNKNPFTHSWSSLLEGVSGDIQDFAEGYTGERMARKNLEAQKEQWSVQNELNERQFQYQQQLNTQQQQREDTAMQRKVADLKAAGLNPVLAANGSGASSAPLSAPALKAPSAPHLDDYSAGVRGAVDQVLGLISMKKNFAVQDAQIQKLKAEKANIFADTAKKEEETANLRIINQYEDQYLKGRNQGQEIANEMHSFGLHVAMTKLPYELASMQNDIDLQEKEKQLKQMESDVYKLRITGLELDNIWKGLNNSAEFKKLSELDQKIQLNAIAIAMKQAEFDEYQYARSYFHERLAGAPVGYSLPNVESLYFPIVRKAVDEVADWVPKPPTSINYNNLPKSGSKSPFDKSYKRSNWPGSANPWSKFGDYGVRRNF